MYSMRTKRSEAGQSAPTFGMVPQTKGTTKVVEEARQPPHAQKTGRVSKSTTKAARSRTTLVLLGTTNALRQERPVHLMIQKFMDSSAAQPAIICHMCPRAASNHIVDKMCLKPTMVMHSAFTQELPSISMVNNPNGRSPTMLGT